MNGYVIMYSNGKYLIINNPNEKFFMKMDVHITDNINEATHFDSVENASYVNERVTYKNKKGSVIKKWNTNTLARKNS